MCVSLSLSQPRTTSAGQQRSSPAIRSPLVVIARWHVSPARVPDFRFFFTVCMTVTSYTYTEMTGLKHTHITHNIQDCFITYNTHY